MIVAGVVRGESGGHLEMRRAIFEGFRYNPEIRAQYLEQAVPDQEPSVNNDPDIIYLAKFEVRDRPLPRGLGDAILKARQTEPKNHSRFGTGIHEKDFGKVRASAVTLFYVPVFVGLSW
jgi:hypothetical protein